MKNINVGIIGWGFMGKTHAHALRALPLFYPDAGFKATIAGICSRRIEMAKLAASDLNVNYYTDDYRELLARQDIDAVSICTPNDLHEDMAIAALRAGKHVYIDKPLSVTAESAARIADIALNSGVHTRMVFNNRYLPCVMRAKELINESAIGNVLTFNARYLHSGSIDPKKPIGWKQSMTGGVLLDLGSHVLDLLTWLIGYPSEVFCAMRTLYPERPTRDGGATSALSDDQTIITAKMKSGALGFIEVSKISTGANDELTLEIRGDRGALKIDLMQPNYIEFYDNTLPERPLGGMRGFTRIESVARYDKPAGTFLPPKNSIGWDRGHIHCYYTFLNEIANNLPDTCPISDGAKLQALMSLIQKSSDDNKWISVEQANVNLTKERIL